MINLNITTLFKRKRRMEELNESQTGSLNKFIISNIKI